ncbi:unnamed protein product [Macrosiphum euphorbiae]|uniref:Uncharacterized protein n=1 Tax=Macrosiphum euphorbiae TaxID=13131 RepID=A0AAV0WP85_9HEMI|nr:unnamed protein product [Macrosiphum euphorbiae]
MGSHHELEINIPDCRIYNVDNVLELVKVKNILATEGLEDPWLREEKEEEPKNNATEIDDEGYCIQPSEQWTVDKKETFDASSDSDCFKYRASDTKTVNWKFAELTQYSESQCSGSLKVGFEILDGEPDPKSSTQHSTVSSDC